MRVLTAVALCTLAASFGWRSFASTPSSGTISPSAPILDYDVALQAVANQSPLGLGQIDKGPRCGTGFPCDSYTLTVDLPAGFVAQNDCAAVKVALSWTDTDPSGASPSDYDLYIYQGVVDTLNGTQSAPYSSAGSFNPEATVIFPLQDGVHQYTIKVVPFQPAGETPHVHMQLVSGSGCAGVPNFGAADATAPGVPRYQNFDSNFDDGFGGEFNIGFNPLTGRILTFNESSILRLTPPERLAQAKPECCLGLWEDVTNPSTLEGLDPILWTDSWKAPAPLPGQPAAGARTFAANSTAGTNGLYGFTDDDGDTWLPLSASPPNASSDHETIGSGPYPNTLPYNVPQGLGDPNNPVTHGHAVYYCAQTFPVGAAACQRSDTYGASYGPSTLPYTGNNGDLCGGIHGHVHVGPDGTVYLPIRDCSGNAGLAVSTDAGATWTERIVPNTPTQAHGSDPSVAIDANNKVYFFYVADNPPVRNEGHIHVQVSTDHGATWSKDHDLGASHGIVNAVFPEAVAGDSGRAACGFLGTDIPGFYEGITFPGIWYLFIATTYDGGDSWVVVNATPNDPVQGGIGIWQGGGSPDNRNLLDFDEITMDDKGRVLFGYTDGCIGACLSHPSQPVLNSSGNYPSQMKVARQIGGKTLLAAYDVAEPIVPKAPCLSGSRNSSGVHLSWKAPDNGGADITSYAIYRGNAAGSETLLLVTNTTKTSFDDITADPTQPVFYKVRAINTVDPTGGAFSQEVNFPATPGIQLLGISSVKSHGGVNFGIDLPLNGTGIECRSGGANGTHQLVFDFANPVATADGATISAGTGSVLNTQIINGNYVVNLTGVDNAQRLGVTLTNVRDSSGNVLPSLTAVMGVLAGDTTGDGIVNSADIAQTKSKSGQAVDGTNFRNDVTIDANLNSADISLVKSKSGTGLPATGQSSSAAGTTAAQSAPAGNDSHPVKSQRRPRFSSNTGSTR